MRYTEARLQKMAEEMLADLDKDTVDFGPNFDDSLEEPLVLPARLPNLLLNGSAGIAVGMATNIPPHNLHELAGAINYLIDKYDKIEDVTVDELMKFVIGPDFPTGGIIVGTEGILSAYSTGRGRIVMRGVAHIEETKAGRHQINITEIPYQINKTTLIERIAELVREDKLDQISDLRDDSDQRGMSIIIELKRSAQPKKVLNQLYKYTTLQSTFGVIMLALVDGEPRILPLKRALQIFIEHRQTVIVRRTNFELTKARARLHILDGLMIALNNIDAVVKTIREAADAFRSQTRGGRGVMGQSTKEEGEVVMLIPARSLNTMLFFSDKGKVYSERVYQIPDADRTGKGVPLVNILSLDANEKVTAAIAIGNFSANNFCIMMTGRGKIKRVKMEEFASVRPSGLIAMSLEEGDTLGWARLTTGKDEIIIVTERGQALRFSENKVRSMGRQAAGVNGIRIAKGDQVTSMDVVEKDGSLLVVTTKGFGKQTSLKEYTAKGRATGGISTIDQKALKEIGKIAAARVVQKDDDLTIMTANGVTIRLKVKYVKQSGSAAKGVQLIHAQKGDSVASVARTSAEDLKKAGAQASENGEKEEAQPKLI